MNAQIRPPAVAGQFYPGRPQLLQRDIELYTRYSGEKVRAAGCIVPHAGYMYSGHVAGAVYVRLQLPRRFIMLCPNHTGMGAPLALMSAGAWATPLGEARLDREMAARLQQHCPLLREDAAAHLREHALEVQLPFLQTLAPDFSFVPIAIGVGRYDALEALGVGIAAALDRDSGDALVIASSDMNHYESDQVTRVKDKRALDRILALDPRGLYDVITQQHITMCGFGAAIAMLIAAGLCGATRAELVKYATSGDAGGDRDAVVGYAGVVVL